MNQLQYWNKKGIRVLRVQQSLGDGKYRVVSVPLAAAEADFASTYTVPSWAVRYGSRESAEDQLLAFAELHGLKKYELKNEGSESDA